MNAYLQEIGERVRSARLAKHLSQAELAEKLDVTPTYISNLEQGKNTMSILVFQKITEALNVSADWLLRANTPELAQISDAEITALLEDCDAEEREMLTKTLIHVKAALRQYECVCQPKSVAKGLPKGEHLPTPGK